MRLARLILVISTLATGAVVALALPGTAMASSVTCHVDGELFNRVCVTPGTPGGRPGGGTQMVGDGVAPVTWNTNTYRTGRTGDVVNNNIIDVGVTSGQTSGYSAVRVHPLASAPASSSIGYAALSLLALLGATLGLYWGEVARIRDRRQQH